MEQTDLQDTMTELDPSWTCRQANGCSKKNSELDRVLFERAIQERQRRIRLVHQHEGGN